MGPLITPCMTRDIDHNRYPHAQTLDLRHNRLSKLPAPASDFETFWPALTSLDAAHNLLASLPDSIARLWNLETLSLANNQLSTGLRPLASSITMILCSSRILGMRK